MNRSQVGIRSEDWCQSHRRQNGKPTIAVESSGIQREALLTLAVEAAGGVQAGGAGTAHIWLIAAFVVV